MWDSIPDEKRCLKAAAGGQMEIRASQWHRRRRADCSQTRRSKLKLTAVPVTWLRVDRTAI